MNLHEYQAKELLKKFDLPILKGKSYNIKNLSSIKQDLEEIFHKGPPWVLKSQIHAGGRGAGYFKESFNNKGGVQKLSKKSDVIKISKLMLGNTLITKQTGQEGKKVNKLFIEEGCQIIKEFYLSIIVDRKEAQLMMIISGEGGIDIEEVAERDPKKIYKIYFPNLNNINLPNELQNNLNLSLIEFKKLKLIIQNLIKAFKSLDASTIEINPLVINKAGNFVLLDAKLSLDDNALYRHPELEKFRDISEEDPLELEASKNGMNYVKLKGSIGCMVNGAGLAMATMDIIQSFGSEPANFLDLGGTANKERTINGFKVILINIFGGIVRCDMVAESIVYAFKELKLELPVVVRFQGTNADQGKQVINSSKLNIIVANTLSDAAKKVVEASSY